jgi:asparagine synthase (glutamine-hydrolysing)
MCGIGGITSHGDARVSPSAIAKLKERISHRGPDGQAVWYSADGQTALAHARLSILDLSVAADQPMLSSCGRYVIVYNGEIYNFLELARELEGMGRVFRTRSDTEVLLEAWSVWGAKMVHRLNGMWAFAIYDNVSRSLFLSRDRFGVKPLYYYADDEWFIFASEAQAIHRLIPRKVEPNRDFLRVVAQSGIYAPDPDTTYLSKVRSLIPGGNLCVSGGKTSLTRWYFLGRCAVPSNFNDQVSEFRALLEDACRIRMRSDVPVATCLSGGIDSSSIVSLLADPRISSGDRETYSHHSFTASFPGTDLDEAAQAAVVARGTGTKLDTYIIKCPTATTLELAMSECDGPMPSLAFFPIWALYKHVKHSGISVTIDGQGADEMLGGYYLGYAGLKSAWQRKNVARMLDMSRTYSALTPTAATWVSNDLTSLRREIIGGGLATLKAPVRRWIGRPDIPPQPPRYDLSFVPIDASYVDSNADDELSRALLSQFFFNPLPFFLHQFDRAAMAHGVECRMPFMDYRLVEFSFSLPTDSRVGRGHTKRILREAMRGTVPETILSNRTKTGFGAPLQDWLVDGLREWACDVLDAAQSECEDLFDARELRDQLYANAVHLEQRVVWSRIHIAWWLMAVSCWTSAEPVELSA